MKMCFMGLLGACNYLSSSGKFCLQLSADRCMLLMHCLSLSPSICLLQLMVLVVLDLTLLLRLWLLLLLPRRAELDDDDSVNDDDKHKIIVEYASCSSSNNDLRYANDGHYYFAMNTGKKINSNFLPSTLVEWEEQVWTSSIHTFAK